MTADPFLAARYDALNDSPAQRKFRRLRPMPIGCVFIEWPGMTEEDIRGHFRLMKELGFTCLKQLCTCPGSDRKAIMHWALDEGIMPWWYAEAGWEDPTPDLAAALGLPRDATVDTILADLRYQERQQQLMRARVDAGESRTPPHNPAAGVAQGAAPWEPMPHSIGTTLPESFDDRFVAWLQTRYGTPQAVSTAWNLDHYNIIANGMAWRWESWEQVAREWRRLGHNEYRHLIDLLRFKAEDRNHDVRRAAERHHALDPQVPFRAGGEMGMFLPFAARATDMEGIASAIKDHGSFYPSIHLAWHFEETLYEVARCVYMQASLASDWFKGGWAATWESTGGPQQLSGGKAWNADRAKETAGFTCDEGTISQLMLGYLAGGFKGVGQWCWSPRTAGWEAGEYALLDRNCGVTARARRAGAIGKAMRRWKDELWAARKEPQVGIFADFDSEALWAAIAHPNRDKYQHEPVHARIGVSRALMDANLPFEHVTGANLRAGLADRYRCIYLPATIGLDRALLDLLGAWVGRGGRLVMDLPGLWYDGFGRLLPTGPGSRFAEIFGASLDDFQYSNNHPRAIGAYRCAAWVADLTARGCAVRATYQDGRPAITEHRHGAGSAVILGWDASLACFQAGNRDGQRLLVEHAFAGIASPYACHGAVALRLPSPTADHYVLLNEAPAAIARLDVHAATFSSVTDAVTGEEVALDAIALEPYSARWLRCAR